MSDKAGMQTVAEGKVHIHELVDLLRQAPDEVFLQPHNVPDPDAIASCFGLQQLLKHFDIVSEIVYEDEIEKSNSVTMLDVFGIRMRHSHEIQTLGEEDWTVLVDVQKGNANVTDLVTDEVACIDHHKYTGPQDCRYNDIRPDTGSCAAIIADYFYEADIIPDSTVSTCLIYGIMSDTENLTRGVSSLDIDMIYKLYRNIDIEILNKINKNQISYTDLQDYAHAFRNVEIYGEIAFLHLDNSNDSLLGSACDLITTIAGVNVVIGYSVKPHGIKYSTRSIIEEVDATELLRHILSGLGICGGHRSMAGGFIKGESIPQDRSIDTFTKYRAIEYVENLLVSTESG